MGRYDGLSKTELRTIKSQKEQILAQSRDRSSEIRTMALEGACEISAAGEALRSEQTTQTGLIEIIQAIDTVLSSKRKKKGKLKTP